MLVLGTRFNNTPIMSLQTGAALGHTKRAIIDPANLTIIAFEIDGPLLAEHPSFLRTNEIREVAQMGMIIDGTDELIGLDDVIKVRRIYDLNFELVGLPVIDEQRHKLGKVENYTLESQGFVIQQLHVKRGFLKGITDTGMLIGRSQIVEINDDAVIVKSTGQRATATPVTETARYEYVNPFRNPMPQVDQQDN